MEFLRERVASVFFIAVRAAIAIAVAAIVFGIAVTWLNSPLLGLAVVIAWCTALLLSPLRRHVGNLALILLSTAVVVAACEIMLRSDFMGKVSDPSGMAEYREGRILKVEPFYIVHDDALGFRLAPNLRVHARLTKRDRLVYDVHYTLGERGYRQLPPGPTSGSPLLILGDSFQFGEGVNDDETLGYWLRESTAGAVQPINLAVPGFGPHQVLRQLEIGEIDKSGHRQFSWAVLSVIDEHVMRASGRRDWLLDSPRYDVAPGGRLELTGTFQSNSRFLDNLLAGSRIATLLHQQLTVDPKGDDIRFVEILRQLKGRLATQYGAQLIVLFHRPDWPGKIAKPVPWMAPLLRQADVSFIDVDAILSASPDRDGPFYFPEDGHPAPALNRVLAKELLDRIGIASRVDTTSH